MSGRDPILEARLVGTLRYHLDRQSTRVELDLPRATRSLFARGFFLSDIWSVPGAPGMRLAPSFPSPVARSCIALPEEGGIGFTRGVAPFASVALHDGRYVISIPGPVLHDPVGLQECELVKEGETLVYEERAGALQTVTRDRLRTPK